MVLSSSKDSEALDVCVCASANPLTERKMLSFKQGLGCFQKNGSGLFICRLLSSTTGKTPEQIAAEAKKSAKRKETHITLVHPDKTITHTTLEDATKLSNRRDLKLIKISAYDRKRDSPVYKIMTAAQFREEALSLKKSKNVGRQGPYKSEKLVPLNSKIGEHDLESKLRKIVSWLEKNHEIRVTISCSKEEELPAGERVYKKMEDFIGSQGRILQKRSSGTDIKFQVVPPKQPASPKKGADANESKTAV